MRAPFYSRLCAALILLLLASSGRGFAAPASVVTTNFPMHIVTCEDGVDVDALLREHGVTPRHRYRYALNGFAAPLPPGIIEKLRRDKRVLAVEADGIANVCDQTVPPGITRIGADVFAVGHSNAPINVDVAILDSGIDPHPDLPPNYQTYFGFGTDGSDSLNHGTSVAGVLAAQDNGYGVVGVAPGVRVWNVKCIGPSPYNTWTMVINGMNYVASHSNEISVANVSIGNSAGGAPYTAIRSAVRRMVNAGIVVVAAAGNNARDMAGVNGAFGDGDDALPAGLAEAMAVSSIDPQTDTFDPLSNFSQIPRVNNVVHNMVLSSGLTIDVVAPGKNILTTAVGSNYITTSGTSFAAPHVAGLVALYIAANGRATNCWGVFKIRQAIVDASLAQSQWRTNQTGDPDTQPEPVAMVSSNWIPTTPPTIFVQPTPQSVGVGSSAIFSVVTAGLSSSYQWTRNGTNLSDNLYVSGSTARVLTLANVGYDDAGSYRVVVTNSFGSITSAVAVLSVVPPNLVQDGSFESPGVGSAAFFPAGTNFGGVWWIESTTAGFVIVNNSYGDPFYPTPAGTQFAYIGGNVGETTIRQDLAIPLHAGFNEGFSGLVTLSIAPVGSTNAVFTQDYTVPANAPWTQQQTNFTVPADGLYSLRLKSTQNFVANVDRIAIYDQTTILTQPSSQAVAAGNNAAFTVTAGGSTPLTYQWLLNGTNLADNARVTGSTTSNLMVSTVAQNDLGNYQAVVTGLSGSITSAVAVLSFFVLGEQTDPHPGNLVQDGSFESPAGGGSLTTGQNFGGVWLVENTDYSFSVSLNQYPVSIVGLTVNWHPTPSGNQLANLNYLAGATVIRQDIATPLSVGTNYNLSFLQSGYVDFRAPAQVIASIAPTGSTNQVWSQTFTVASNADWTLKQAGAS